MQAKTPAGLAIDQLFVSGKRQIMARHPNLQPDVLPYGGVTADAFSKQRTAAPKNPPRQYQAQWIWLYSDTCLGLPWNTAFTPQPRSLGSVRFGPKGCP
ncbi:MAG: hypothetical protein HY674_23565 [Chloroflexi bacterium]|nr:hypothetical protein [Chloroflexota bacterium]